VDRIQLGQSGTLNASWERDGELWDPGTVTVTIASQRTGSQLVSGVAASGTGTAGRTLVLTPSQTSALDYYTISWTSSEDGSVLTTYADIVGGFLFSVAQARARSPLGDTTNYPTEAILYYRTLAEAALEDICGVAFVPRFSQTKARIVGAGMLEVSRRYLTNVVNVYTTTNDGLQVLPTLSGLRIENGGTIWMPAYWNFWAMPIVVAYEHGYNETPFRVSRAALELAKRWLIESPWDERMTMFRSREGGEVDILTAQQDPFDIPEVVAIANIYGTPMIA
jgi:hypothetical protein